MASQSPFPSPGIPLTEIFAADPALIFLRLSLFILVFRQAVPFFFTRLTPFHLCCLPDSSALTLTNGLSMQHRTTQSYQNVAPVHHVQQSQSRTLSSSQTPQQPYPSPNVYTPQSGLQSPFLNNPPQFQAQQAPNEAPSYYPSNPSPRSQHSGAGAYYPTGKLNRIARAPSELTQSQKNPILWQQQRLCRGPIPPSTTLRSRIPRPR